MALKYRVIEITLDTNDNEIKRQPSWSAPTLEQAVNCIENVLSRCEVRGCASDGTYWWGTAMNGDRMRFTIEAV
jgi:hypothetical protein